MDSAHASVADAPQPGMSDESWDRLLGFVRDNRCTPFLGAGASAGAVKAAGPMATEWADAFGYPLTDRTNLARVSQFLAIKNYEMDPKDRVVKSIEAAQSPAFDRPDEPHGALARLKLPLYVTTNYDTFMFDALKAHGSDPRWDICRWNEHPALKAVAPVLRPRGGHVPTAAQPVVFHLHGRATVPQSLVLTEDDYLDFLVRLAKNKTLLPAPLPQALTSTVLLFVGYSLSDWTFRVLIRSLVRSFEANLGYPAVAIQLNPADAVEGKMAEAREYVVDYLRAIQLANTLDVYWGPASQFAEELTSNLA